MPLDQAIIEEQAKSAQTWIIACSVVSIVVLISASVMVYLCRRTKREKAKRKKVDEYARTVVVWTKRVMVEMQRDAEGSNGGGGCQDHSGSMIMPNVVIQREPATSRYEFSPRD